jgi:hypothetical protein
MITWKRSKMVSPASVARITPGDLPPILTEYFRRVNELFSMRGIE